MTARQRQGTGGATTTLPHSEGAGSSHDRAVPLTWDDWFRHANAQQRANALKLALQQGVLYPHQLPQVTNGVKPIAAPVCNTEPSIRISDLLADIPTTLPQLTPESISFFDIELDSVQQQAVMRGIGTSDLFLLQGLPGTGKSRVLAEISLQAAARGRRVLLLGAQPASIDVVLERLGGRAEILAVRYLDPAEKAGGIPLWLHAMTTEELTRAFLDRVCTGAQTRRNDSETACRTHRAAEPHWQSLQACLKNMHAVSEQLRLLDERAAHYAEVVEREADAGNGDTPFAVKMADWRGQRDAAVAAMETKLGAIAEAHKQVEQEAASLAARIALLEPAYRAKKESRVWSLAYWANLFNSRVVPEMEGLLGEQTHISGRQSALTQELAQLERDRQESLKRFADERAALVSLEAEARSEQLRAERAPLDVAARQFEEEWQTLCTQLGIVGLEKTAAALTEAHAAWQSQKRQDDEQCQFAQQWSAYLERSVADYAARLPQFANVVATTRERWLNDAQLRDAIGGPVDYVIIEDADTLSAADLGKLAQSGRRCILVATGLPEKPDSAASPFQHLWQTLGGDGASTCVWRRVEGRLVCQLVPFSADEEPLLESERVADAPDIELGILARSDGAPCLARVVFGPERSFADAFQFMMREVQEFPLAPAGRSAWWSESADQVTHWFGESAATLEESEIEPGIRLGTIAKGDEIRVACIAFAKSAGHDRTSAAAWLQGRRPSRACERTIFLEAPHRFRPALASVLAPLVFTQNGAVLAPDYNGARPFEFIAVPALPKKDWPLDGAGLELDLSVARMAERLPVGLRQGLPPRGFVNYVEAQALVRRLETFCQKDVNGQTCRVVATALYASQVELLRRLVTQSETLRNTRVPIEITMPDRLQQRECDVLFLSLTRSHEQGEAAFDTAELAFALTRARSRVFVFGDPGTLTKRSNHALLCRLADFLRNMHRPPAKLLIAAPVP